MAPLIFSLLLDAEEAVELLVDNDGQEAQFVVRGIDCHASLESTGISLTPARSWKSLLGVSIPRHSRLPQL